jgi:hypothetical protein
MEDKMYIKIYTNCSVCIGKGIVESVSFRNTNVCPVCKGAGKNEHLITLEEFKKMLLDDKNH